MIYSNIVILASTSATAHSSQLLLHSSLNRPNSTAKHGERLPIPIPKHFISN